MALSSKCKSILDDGYIVDMCAPGTPRSAPYPTDERFEEFVGGYERAGCNWVSFTVAADFVWSTDGIIDLIAKAREWFLARPERFVLIDKADDIIQAKKQGKLAVCLHFQGTAPFLNKIHLIGIYRKLGIFSALMAYNDRNLVGDGVHVDHDAGLTKYGHAVVREMNRVGMMVDVSHTGYRTAFDTIAASSAPVVMTHSNPLAHYKHPRNVPDDLMSAVAKTGGVIGINGIGIFMTESGTDASAEQMFQLVDYTVQLVGANHVGFGIDHISNIRNLITGIKSELDGAFDPKFGYHNENQAIAAPSVIAEIADIMLQRNYKEDDVKKIIGGNWLRVFREVCG